MVIPAENCHMPTTMNEPATLSSPPQLDHVFVTVDAKTLKGINECQFLVEEELGRFLIRDAESTLLGRYEPTRVFGKNTLVEIFPNAFGGNDTFKGVSAGVIFSFDRVGQTEVARQRLTDCGISFEGELVERIVRSASGQTDHLPWYVFTRPNMGEKSTAALFFHELTPAYFARIGAKCDAEGRQNRSDHFDAALKRPHSPNHLMQDIVGVTIRLARRHIDHAAGILTAFGYSKSVDGDVVSLRGPTGEIKFVADDSAPGAVELKIRLSRPMPGRRFEFSPSSSLVLSPLGADDHFATWTFVPPASAAGAA